jgi:hypothetical protein
LISPDVTVGVGVVIGGGNASMFDDKLHAITMLIVMSAINSILDIS